MSESEKETTETPSEDVRNEVNTELPTSAPEETGALGAEASAAQEATKPEEPVVICELCGPLKGPGAEVFMCQLCMRNFCIQHVDPFFHQCPSSRQS
jgi:hypothetical protein